MSIINSDQYITKLKTKSSVEKTIPAGIYEIHPTMDDLLLVKKNIVMDSIIDIPESESDIILKEIDEFSKPETKALYKEYGTVYKKGFLLHGKAGTGKSVTAVTAANKLVTKSDAIVFFNPDPHHFKAALEIFQEDLNDRMIILLLEEFETVYQEDPSNVLSLLDGESQIKNFITIACTNYLEQLPERIKSRPSRFSTIMEILPPTNKVREIFIKGKLLDRDMDKLDALVEATEGFTIDQIKDVVLSTCVFKLPISSAILKIKEMQANSIGEENIKTHVTNNYISELRKEIKGITSTLRSRR
jgi:SpoVK/Ycf46/Vps4 family AAA+-type ATPase